MNATASLFSPRLSLSFPARRGAPGHRLRLVRLCPRCGQTSLLPATDDGRWPGVKFEICGDPDCC